MQRHPIAPRVDWEKKCEALGFSFHSLPSIGGPYWHESAYYSFTAAEIDELEEATAALHQMCLDAVEHVIRHDLYDRLHLPAAAKDFIYASWARRDPHLFGRFDLAYDGQSPPKLLEYNADTPMALLEASVIQWHWLEECFPDADQFNTIHEQMISRLDKLRQEWGIDGQLTHFTCAGGSDEDQGTLSYLMDIAYQAGLQQQQYIAIEDIGWDRAHEIFVDLQEQKIATLIKLYPWECLLVEPFGAHLLQHPVPHVLEPAWKAILNNKAILALLWELYPEHPNLLPAYFDESRLNGSFVRKPIFSREGANISLYKENTLTALTNGPYGKEGYVYQAYTPIPCFNGIYTTIGSWVIGDQPAGIGIREDATEITEGSSRFVPHLFR